MRVFFPILLLALAPAAIPVAEATAPAAVQQGEEALASGLWEIAVARYNNVLQDPA